MNSLAYVSTRSAAAPVGFEQALLSGLAPDGGLYVPAAWPALDRAALAALSGLAYAELAHRVMMPFVAGAIAEDDFAAMVADAYGGFGHRAVAPLKQLAANEWLMELFHGPTLAFKDYPLQLLGRLFDHVLTRRGQRVTIVGATSGDTGSAAIEACRGRDAIDIFILHPRGRVSEVQRRQMTTVDAPNVHNLAIEGTFDDCQDLVKAMFNDAEFNREQNLSAVNSINWARIMAQTVYYVAAALALGAPDREVAFSVPTGNFGNVFAGYGAAEMGLPVKRLYIASNRNDILTRFVETGTMSMAPVQPSLSPSMDIQISSNFERLLFDLYGRDADAVRAAMEAFRATGEMPVAEGPMAALRARFGAGRLDDDATCAAIAAVWRETGEILDPHTAVGVAVARALHDDPAVPLVSLATAHPAKFPDAVERAIGLRPTLPERLSGLMEMAERFDALPNDVDAVKAHIRERSGAAA